MRQPIVHRLAVTLAAVALASPVRAEAVAPCWWQPTKGLSWQWQLSGKLDLTVPAVVYDIDAETSSTADVAAPHKAGRKAVCHVDAGSYEKGRPDAKRFPAAVLGKAMDGWPDERWLDIRRWDVLKPILTDRFTTWNAEGFDGRRTGQRRPVRR